MTKQLLDMLDKKQFAAKLISLKVESFKANDWDRFNAFEFESDIIFICSISKYVGSCIVLKYFIDDKTGMYTKYVPDTMALDLLAEDDERVLNLRKAYDKFALKNLTNTLYHNGIISAVGSDPEIFVEEDGKIIPAFNFLGSKGNPTKAPQVSHGNNNIYWDGFQAEFDTSAVACLSYHVDSIQNGLKGLLMAARKYNKKAKLSSATTFDIPVEYLESAKDEHVEFGCMPSKNAYNMEGTKLNGREVPFRSAGGHIHFGLTDKSETKILECVKTLDAILAVACVSLFEKFDNPRRRVMYGLAGEYRLPKHGLEYRTLSNAWMCHPLITNIIFDTARKVFMFGYKGMFKHWQATEEETVRVINTCDVAGARAILDRNKELFINILVAKYGIDAEYVFNIFMNGIHSVVLHPEDIEHNWNLNGEWITHCEGAYKGWHNSVNAIKKNMKVS